MRERERQSKKRKEGERKRKGERKKRGIKEEDNRDRTKQKEEKVKKEGQDQLRQVRSKSSDKRQNISPLRNRTSTYRWNGYLSKGKGKNACAMQLSSTHDAVSRRSVSRKQY